MNGVALILCSVNPDFEATAKRLIAKQGTEEDKKNIAWMFIKAMKTFDLDVFEKWLTVAAI